MIISTLVSFSNSGKIIIFSLNKKTPSFVTSDYNMNEVRISPFNQNLAELLINSLVAQEEGIRQRAIKMELNSPSKIGFLAPLGINPKKHSSCKKNIITDYLNCWCCLSYLEYRNRSHSVCALNQFLIGGLWLENLLDFPLVKV